MTILLDKCENRLSIFYDNLKKNPKKEFAFALLIYTIIFALIAAGTLGKVMYRTGTIAGTDGSAQYIPMLIDFRYNLRHIFKSISEGQFSIKMMNFDFMFGADTITASTMFFLPFLPVYILAALIPVKMLGVFYGIVTILLSYICGITFILMCRHFKANILWSSVFAPTYVFCGNYFYTIIWNQQFLYAMSIFPIMIIGIDRILHNKSCKLFVLCTSYLFLSGFVSIIYTVPFVVVFAAVQLYFIDNTKYPIKLLRYFAKGVLCVLLGMLLSAFSLFPYLYLFFNTSRSTGTPPDIKTLILPSSKYISDILYSYDINGAIGLRPVLVFFLFFCIFSIKAEKIHKILSAIGLLLFSFPLIWYGLNGFMYDICRWGYIPSCLFAFIATFYAPKVFQLSKIELFSFTLIFSFFLIAIPFHLEYICFAIMLLFSVVSSIYSTKNKLLISINKLKNKFKIANAKLKRYLMMAALIVSVLSIILICEIFIVSPYYDVSKGVLYIFISLLLILLVSNIKNIQHIRGMFTLFGSLLFISSTVFYLITCRNELNSANTIKFDSFFEAISSYDFTPNYSNRFSSIDSEKNSYIANSSFSFRKSETESSVLTHSNPGINTTKISYEADLALKYRFPSSEVFFSCIDKDYMNFLKRCEMDGASLTSIVDIRGYSNKEAIYSIMGVNNMYSDFNETSIYGVSRNTNSLYKGQSLFINNYAFPLGVTYDKTISKRKFNSFNPAELPYAMINTVYLENDKNSTTISDDNDNDKYFSRKIDFTLQKNLKESYYFGSDCTDNTIILNEDISQGFIYLRFLNANYRSLPLLDENLLHLVIDNKDEVICDITNNNADWPWKFPRTEYTISLGYCKETIHEIRYMAFFEYDDVEMYYIPESIYTEGYKEATREILEDVKLDTNTLTGTINVSSDKVLCINLLHNDGWKAYVDDIATPIYKANGLFLGIKLKEGPHNIKLVYRTPWLYEGIICSVISTIILIIVYNWNRISGIFLTKRRRRI